MVGMGETAVTEVKPSNGTPHKDALTAANELLNTQNVVKYYPVYSGILKRVLEHALSVVEHISDRVTIMCLGKLESHRLWRRSLAILRLAG
ncbi:MAG: hypothetical protein H6668_00380 [Ardenticatenaceae bacterium]|nr:hypothetical protein [Ardenticatenaceae bacterium]